MTSEWSLQDDLTTKCNAVVQEFTRNNVCYELSIPSPKNYLK